MTDFNIKEEKSRLRKLISKQRNSIAPPDVVVLSEIICKYIESGSKYIRCQDILLYNSFGSEVKTDHLFNKALADGKNVYFPRVEDDLMNFYRVESKEELTEGFKGILEPFGNSPRFSKDKAIVIVPGLVFGKDGYRIGYGRGFYDNFLKRFPDLYTIGICFSNQIIDQIPTEEHDEQLDEIVCENFILNREGTGDARWI